MKCITKVSFLILLFVHTAQFQPERKLFPISENAKFGFADSSGNIVISPQFDRVSSFQSGLAMVEVDGKKGYVNESGQTVIDPQYDEAEDFSDGLAAVKRGGLWGFINTSGKEIVPTVNVEVRSFSDGLAAVSFQPEGRWGYLNKNGDVVIAAKFFKAFDFHDGFAKVIVGKFGGSNKQGFIDKKGNFIIEPKYELTGDYSEGLIPVQAGRKDKWGFIDTNGKMVIPAKFDGADEFSEGLANVTVGEKYGYIDKSGKIVITPQFDYSSNAYRCANFIEGRACFEQDGKIGFIDTKGNVVIPPQFEFVTKFSDGIAQVNFGAFPDSVNERFPINDNYGLIDRSGRVIYKPSNKNVAEKSIPVDEKIYEGWQKIEGGSFSFYAPRGLQGGKRRGIDTAVYEYRSAELTILFDIGMMANPAPPHPPEMETMIDGQKAIIWHVVDEGRQSGRYVSYLHVALGANYNKTNFNMIVSSNTKQAEVAEKMFKSLRFK